MVTLNLTATYDVQNVRVGKDVNGNGITVTGEFITDSRARGCFLVFQSSPSSGDIYRVLQRNIDSVTSFSDTISLPPSTYTVYAYDLEENALPNPMPVNTPEDQITIDTPSKIHG